MIILSTVSLTHVGSFGGKLSYFGPPLEQLPPYYLKQASPPERCKYNQVNLYFFVFQLPDLHLVEVKLDPTWGKACQPGWKCHCQPPLKRSLLSDTGTLRSLLCSPAINILRWFLVQALIVKKIPAGDNLQLDKPRIPSALNLWWPCAQSPNRPRLPSERLGAECYPYCKTKSSFNSKCS